jgi:hypothetical protein
MSASPLPDDYGWSEAAAARLAESVGDPAADYGLGVDEITRLLDLARVAAHESGIKSNAPLVSYLVGLAHARHPDRSLDELVETVTGERERAAPPE